jgi:hypothetical protein
MRPIGAFVHSSLSKRLEPGLSSGSKPWIGAGRRCRFQRCGDRLAACERHPVKGKAPSEKEPEQQARAESLQADVVREGNDPVREQTSGQRRRQPRKRAGGVGPHEALGARDHNLSVSRPAR